MKRGAAVRYRDKGISLALFLCVDDKEELMVAG